MNPSPIAIRHCRAVLPSIIIEDAFILIAQGVVEDVSPERASGIPSGYGQIDAGGCLVGPGFIDPHCHGDGAASFFEKPGRVVDSLLRHGTTGVLATLGYNDISPDLPGQLRRFWRGLAGAAGEVVLGVHLEGPYTNPKYGARTHVGGMKGFDRAEYEAILADPDARVRWWTCAPELPGADAFITAAAGRGVVVAAGHTEASAEETLAAAARGLKVITHWTNATGNLRLPRYRGTRRPGIDEAALVCDELTAEVIPDEGGRHVHPLMARLLYRAKGPDRILVITDAYYRLPDFPPPAAGFDDVFIDESGDLCGSRLDMAKAARNFQRFSGCSLPELFRMASLNAARLLRLDHLVGSIERGKKANLVMLDEDFNVKATFIGGRRQA